MKPSMKEFLFDPETGMLTSVRRIIAITMTCVFCYLTIVGKVAANEFIPIFSMVIGYYFGKSTALDNPAQNIQKSAKRTTKKNNDSNTQ